MYRNGIAYSFTFNFNDDHQYFEENDVHRIRKIYKAVKKVGTLLDKVSHFKLYPEFSTPEPYKCLPSSRSKKLFKLTSAPRFHFHGIIKFVNVGYFYYQIYRKLLDFGLWEIDTIEDMKKWKIYYLKDREIMEPFLKDYKISYKFTNTTKLDEIDKSIRKKGSFTLRFDNSL